MAPKFSPVEIGRIIELASGDQALIELAKAATATGGREALGKYVDEVYIHGRFKAKSHEEIAHIFLTWVFSKSTQPSGELKEACRLRKQSKKTDHQVKREFVKSSRLNFSEGEKAEFLSKVPRHTLPRLETPYPPPNKFVCETPAIYEANAPFLVDREFHDKRTRRRPIGMLDEAKLALDLEPDQSALIYSRGSKGTRVLVGAVIREVCGNDSTVEMVDGILKEAIDAYWDIRMDDPGKLVQNGVTAGSRRAPVFGWARNIRHRNFTQDYIKSLQYRQSAAFALYWNLVKSTAPREVVSDVRGYLERTGICRMDADRQMKHSLNGKGSYKVSLDDPSGQAVEFEFNDVELAPPTGMSAENYCRFIHRESQPHEFAISWTTSRTTTLGVPDKELGGHFYMADYGVRVQAAKNTMIAWRTKDWHGTSLRALANIDDPENPVYSHRGIAFVTSNRLPKVWAEYMKAGNGYGSDQAIEDLFGDVGDVHRDDDDIADGLEPESESLEVPPPQSRAVRRSKRKIKLTEKAVASGMKTFKSWADPRR